jgi:hypothetical protein
LVLLVRPPKIGHSETWLIDKVQLLVEQNHGTLAYPHWSNESATALTPVIHEEEEEASSSSLGAAVAEAPRKSSVISLAGQRKNSMALMSNAPLSQFNAKCTAAAAAMPIHHVLELASGRFMAINMKRRCTASLTARGDGGEVGPEEHGVGSVR